MGGVYRPPFIMAQVQNIIKKTSGSIGEDLDIINTATDDTSVAGIYRNINILYGNNSPTTGTTPTVERGIQIKGDISGTVYLLPVARTVPSGSIGANGTSMLGNSSYPWSYGYFKNMPYVSGTQITQRLGSSTNGAEVFADGGLICYGRFTSNVSTTMAYGSGYNTGDKCTYQGKKYISKINGNTTIPGSDNRYWE